MIKSAFNTHLHGFYVIEDSEGKEICRSNNIITDWAMNRLTGNFTGNPGSAPWSLAFINNTKHILIGKQVAPSTPAPSDWQLEDLINSIQYTVNNVPARTGTTIQNNGSHMRITYTRMHEFTFNIAQSSPITEVGCHWSDATFAPNDFDGIFSRALLPSPVPAPAVGSKLFIRYELIITTDSNKIINDDGGDKIKFYHVPPAQPLPDSFTTMPYCPFYTMNSNGDPVNSLNSEGPSNSCSYWTGSFTAYPARNPRPRSPLFEDFGAKNATKYPTGRFPYLMGLYNSESAWTYGSSVFINPPAGGPATTNLNQNIPMSSAPYSTPKGALADNLIADPSNNKWIRKTRFLFIPGDWGSQETLHFYVSSPNRFLGTATRWSGSGAAPAPVDTCDTSWPAIPANLGDIVTVFQIPYQPYLIDPNIFWGMEYIFTFTRSGPGVYAST